MENKARIGASLGKARLLGARGLLIDARIGACLGAGCLLGK